MLAVPKRTIAYPTISRNNGNLVDVPSDEELKLAYQEIEKSFPTDEELE